MMLAASTSTAIKWFCTSVKGHNWAHSHSSDICTPSTPVCIMPAKITHHILIMLINKAWLLEVSTPVKRPKCLSPLLNYSRHRSHRQKRQHPLRTNQTPNTLWPLPGFPFRSQHTRLNHKCTRNNNPTHMKWLVLSTVSSITIPLSVKLTAVNYNKTSYYYIGKHLKKKEREHMN